MVLPKQNAKESAIVNDLEIIGIDNITEAIQYRSLDREGWAG